MAAEPWTPKRVEARLEEAAEVLRRLPEHRVQGYFSTWPAPVRDYWEAFGWSEIAARRPCPTPAAISRMEQALEWLAWVSRDDARLLWLRAERVPWRVVCARIGVSRATAWRRWVAALMVIAAGLGGGRA